eukprot:GHVU01230937.1.p1 GENE.GHVU01230937.1~~GHVU01230937.1.p1  ORF type:complete len:366 (-),score=37.91 GHVU01230937.1:284-1381(-)
MGNNDSGSQKRQRAKETKERENLAVATNKKLKDFASFSKLPHHVSDSERGTSSHDDRMQRSSSTVEVPSSDTGGAMQSSSSTVEVLSSDTRGADAGEDDVVPAAASAGNELAPDIGLWPVEVTETMREHWVKAGNSVYYLPSESSLKAAEKVGGRRPTQDIFFATRPNNVRHERKWLCYSGATGKVYCFYCRLFGSQNVALSRDGFCAWGHAGIRFREHEASKGHFDAVKCFATRSTELNRIDAQIVKEMEERRTYWEKVLDRLFDVIELLAERGLAFRGDTEIVNGPSNGNYLGIIQLLAKYDAFLEEHVRRYANAGRGITNYLSLTICEELIALMGDSVLREVLERIRKAKYFSLSVDSTPDC